MDAPRPLTEAEKRRIEEEAMRCYYGRDPEALRRLIRKLLEQLEKCDGRR